MHKGVKGGICSKYAVKHKKVKPLDIFFKKTCTPQRFWQKMWATPNWICIRVHIWFLVNMSRSSPIQITFRIVHIRLMDWFCFDEKGNERNVKINWNSIGSLAAAEKIRFYHSFWFCTKVEHHYLLGVVPVLSRCTFVLF